MKAKYPYVLLLLLIAACSSLSNSVRNSDSTPSAICQTYDWDSVQNLAQPYLNDILYTSLVMQGQSSNYSSSSAAAHILDMNIALPKDIQDILYKVRKSEC